MSEPTRVLLVDDDQEDRFAIAGLLMQDAAAGHRYQVDLADSPDTALRLLCERNPAALLIDYRLGAHCGVDLLREIAVQPDSPPAIMLTSAGTPEIDRLALDAGAIDCLDKNRADARTLDRTLRYVIERHRLNRALLAREQMWRTLFDTNPLAMWLYDPSSLGIVEVNAAACRQYGLMREDLLAMSIVDLRAPEERARLHEFLRNYPHEQGLRSHWVHQRGDGSTFEVVIHSSDVEIDQRALRLAIAQDVSAELRNEERLRASESTLRGVLQGLGDGLIVVDESRRVQFANQAACNLLDRDEADLLGSKLQPDALLCGPDQDELVRSDGECRSVDLRINPTCWHGAQATSLMLRDVTDARATERQLGILRRSVESSNEGLLIVDARSEQQAIVYANPAFERITGYRSGEVLGRNCRFLQGEDRQQPEVLQLREAIATRRDCTVTLRNYRKNGTMFWNRLRIAPVRDHKGEVTHFIGLQQDITEQKHIESERNYLATHDAVTGLPRYSGSEGRLETMLAHGQRPGELLGLLFVDIDSFHSVNDTLGYAMGDLALRHLADRLRQVGERVEVLRYAGDEFLVAVPGLAANVDLRELAQRVNQSIAEPMAVSPHATLFLTASIGASCFPRDAENLQELVRQADLAMNCAKRGGRNTAEIFGSEMREALQDRLALGSRMRAAMTRGEFLLHYQPQVDVQDSAVVALEALVRWQSPDFGLLPPRRFVPVAEDCGLIVQLGLLVLRSACEQVREWTAQGLSQFILSINVSAAQIQRNDFIDDVRRVFDETGVAPSMFEFEITESLLMEHANRSVGQLHALKALGVRLALDDFGMGYSSLGYLRRFPIDKLKIDQSFIQEVTIDGSDAALVRAMISMGHHLGLRVVAEGVETLQQSEFLRRCHCDEFQGFFFSPPVPAGEVPALLRRRYLGEKPASAGAAPSLLLVDDEENILRALMRLLRRDGYRVLTATSAKDAFDLLAIHPVQVVLSDQRMSGMSGTEFLLQVKQMYPATVRMVLSGYTDLATVTDAVNRGSIYKFLTKPWNDDDLREQVRQAFRLHEESRPA